MAQPIEMSLKELLALPVTFDLVTAGRAFGLGRTKSHELARADDFPCPVRRIGKRYVVTKPDLFRELGLSLDGAPFLDPADDRGLLAS